MPGSRADEVAARREDQLKAAYLFNFVKFVEWPAAAAGDALIVCFAGGNGVRDALAFGIESKKVGHRPLAVRRLQSLQETAGCSVLYADATEFSMAQLSTSESRPLMLTVSDAKDFARKGGIIELFTDSNRLRFIINVGNARRAGLRIGSALLELATVIDKETAE